MPRPAAERARSPSALVEDSLADIAERHGTPAYVYSLGHVRERVSALRAAFGGRLDVSFALKSNPNPILLRRLAGVVDELEVSSLGELTRALAAGWPAEAVRFTGPAKRDFELAGALAAGIGCVVLESLEEARALADLARARARPQRCLVRISPRHVPPGFGAQLDGKPSRFGIDEEELQAALPALVALPGLALEGFHVFAGSQCLLADSLVEHLVGTCELFQRAAAGLRLPPRQFVLGAGFGIPYAESDVPFDLASVAARALPACERLQRSFPGSRLVLELGRYLVGEAGYYLTRVLRVKRSRGSSIAICDGGLHHNQAACGLFGGVLHRNRSMFVAGAAADAALETWDVVGPLCTALDTLGRRVRLAGLGTGAVVAIRSSGAYGLSASPLLFLDHPACRELVVDELEGRLSVTDASAAGAR